MKVTFEDTELENPVLNHKSKKYKKYQRDGKFLDALDRVFFHHAVAKNSLRFEAIQLPPLWAIEACGYEFRKGD